MHFCLGAATLAVRNAKPTSDVSDDEWALVTPYLTLMTEDTLQREYRLREVFNGLCWIVRAGVAHDAAFSTLDTYVVLGHTD